VPVIEGATYAACEASCRSGLSTDPAPPAAVADQLRARLQSLRDMGWATDETADRLMADTAASLGPKAEGNTAFAAKQYKDAAAKYSAALALNPFDHVFYSNRSACHAGLDEPKEALRDGDACVRLAPAFAKGHGRRATALYMMGSYVESEAAAQVSILNPEP
jgi:tetratricopeptide (TPR) repeat protein